MSEGIQPSISSATKYFPLATSEVESSTIHSKGSNSRYHDDDVDDEDEEEEDDEIDDDEDDEDDDYESNTRPSSPPSLNSVVKPPSTPISNITNTNHDSVSHDNIATTTNNNDFVYEPPKSPLISITDSMMNITPLSSNNGQYSDDFVVYSDSDGASQSSLDLKNPHSSLPHDKIARKIDNITSVIDSASSSNEGVSPKGVALKKPIPRKPSSLSHSTTSPTTPRRRSKSPRKGSGSSTAGTDTEEATATGTPSASATPKSRKKIRRKSNRSEPGSEYIGTGYTSTPATGKIFRNLLILEESLREQVRQQRALRRKYLTFLAVLCSLIASITHHLFLVDVNLSSSGTRRVILQFTLLALIVTLMLYHLSGEYQKTIVLPRKFLSSTNKGLRQLNVRLVKINTPLNDKVIDLIREISLFIVSSCLSSFHRISPSSIQNRNSKLEVFLVSCQSQCQPRIGVTDVKLVLNARVFNLDVREGWEVYRSEFWIHEGVRRRNQMMEFVTNFATSNSEELDKSKLLKKDKKERRDRRKNSQSNPTSGPGSATVPSTPIVNRLSEQNLQKLMGGLNSHPSRSNSPLRSGSFGPESIESNEDIST